MCNEQRTPCMLAAGTRVYWHILISGDSIVDAAGVCRSLHCKEYQQVPHFCCTESEWCLHTVSAQLPVNVVDLQAKSIYQLRCSAPTAASLHLLHQLHDILHSNRQDTSVIACTTMLFRSVYTAEQHWLAAHLILQVMVLANLQPAQTTQLSALAHVQRRCKDRMRSQDMQGIIVHFNC